MSENPKNDHAPNMPAERGGRPVRQAPNAPPVGTPVPAQVMLWYQPMPFLPPVYVMVPAAAAVRPPPGGAGRPGVQDAFRVAAEERESRIARWKHAVSALRDAAFLVASAAGDAERDGMLDSEQANLCEDLEVDAGGLDAAWRPSVMRVMARALLLGAACESGDLADAPLVVEAMNGVSRAVRMVGDSFFEGEEFFRKPEPKAATVAPDEPRLSKQDTDLDPEVKP